MTVVVAVVLLTGLAVPGAEAAVDRDGAAPQQEPSAATNNTTTQHVDPDSVSEPGDTEQVSQWLEGRLLDRLQQSTIEIGQGEYERARGLLGSEFESRLDQYVDVAGETDRSEATGELQSLRENQSEFANTSAAYQRTYDEYERARQRGNTTAAIRSARELDRLAANVTRLNRSLHREYGRVGNLTGADTATSQRQLRNITANISARQTTVRSQTLTETRLTVTTNETTVAFDDPITVSGTVEAANGTAVTNQSGVVVVGARTYPVRTDRNGQFTVTYRPVSLPVSAAAVDVQYGPALSSPYLGATASTPVAVEQVTPSLSTTVTPTTAGYGDTVVVRTTVSVDGRTVPSVPVSVTAAGTSSSRRTNETGIAAVEQQIPATALAGSQNVQIAHARDGLAVGPAETTTAVTVLSTATDASVNATATDGDIQVSGRLTTADGIGVGGRTLAVTIGETSQTVTTNQSGHYRVTASNISIADGTDVSAVPVTVRFDGSATSLENSSATATVNLTSAPADSSPDQSFLELVRGAIGGPFVAMVVGLVLIASIVGLLRRFWSDRATGTDREPTRIETATASATEPEAYLETAQTALSNGDIDRAIVAAYASIRNHYEQQAGIEGALTQREFLRACHSQLSEPDRRLLDHISDAYERLTFTGESDTEAASDAVGAAIILLTDRTESE